MSLPETGVQSFCFRKTKDNRAVARMVVDLGLSRIEVCAAHADFSDESCHADVIAAYREHDVQIVSIGVQTFTGNEEVERRWFRFAQAAGAQYISAHFRVDNFTTAIPIARRLCEEYGIRLALHCHGGYMFGGSADVIAHILELGGPQIGLCLDTAWCMQSGRADPVDWVGRFGDRLYGVHYKDFRFNPDATWEDVIVGTGNLDLPAFRQKLEEVGFDGYAVIEYEGDPDDPVPPLRRCVEAMQVTA